MMNQDEKPVRWIGASYRELCDFPDDARRQAGQNLRQVQNGLMPEDWKSMEVIGPGTYEIRIRTQEGGNVEYRVFYVAKYKEAVYVLHAFTKKAQRTPQHHIDVGKVRYQQLLRERRAFTDPQR